MKPMKSARPLREAGKGGRAQPRPGSAAGPVVIYGLHAAQAALANPERGIHKVYATPNAALRAAAALAQRGLQAQIVTPKELDRMAGPESVHQGILIEAGPPPPLQIEDCGSASLILVLDQVTDPHNAGAVLRSAAAFGVDALIMTERHSPPLSGALAKAACGGLEHVPVVLVTNLATALQEMGEMGFFRIGLDAAAPHGFEDEPPHERLALVLGAEDKGLRRLTRERCDKLCALFTKKQLVSLNVSNAAAIALHHLSRKARQAG